MKKENSKKTEKVKKEKPAKEKDVYTEITQEDIENMSDEEMKDVLEKGRKDIIEGFNAAFKDIAVMVEEKPTEEVVKQAQEDYEKAVKDFQEAKYEIYKGDKALEVAKFLYEWNDKYNHWERQAWKGVIAFHNIMEKKVEELEKSEEKENVIELEYAPLIFIYGSMMSPKGVGYEDANMMEILETDPEGLEDETAAITYSNILEWIGRKVDGLNAVQAKIQTLQERWSMAASGFLFNIASDEPEEYVKFMDIAKNRGNS